MSLTNVNKNQINSKHHKHNMVQMNNSVGQRSNVMVSVLEYASFHRGPIGSHAKHVYLWAHLTCECAVHAVFTCTLKLMTFLPLRKDYRLAALCLITVDNCHY